ncbi:hypothetical protein RHGRI_011386 [Rhododendron griersonianum]|uniref:Uncharacterized protein n=1 Tax=Rhododendron griersonianum TaxID=479676 RepID=A0AAV6KLU2_9ERIC|nr:hypothetical protein RHGRI_011386 [Rhododendron griersonianum]
MSTPLHSSLSLAQTNHRPTPLSPSGRTAPPSLLLKSAKTTIDVYSYRDSRGEKVLEFIVGTEREKRYRSSFFEKEMLELLSATNDNTISICVREVNLKITLTITLKIEGKEKWLNKDGQQSQNPREKIRQLVPTENRKTGKIEGKEKWLNKDRQQRQKSREKSRQLVPTEKKKTEYDAHNFYFLSLPHF